MEASHFENWNGNLPMGKMQGEVLSATNPLDLSLATGASLTISGC